MKITFGRMREMGLRGVLVYCHCGHHVAVDADQWPDEVRLRTFEPRFGRDRLSMSTHLDRPSEPLLDAAILLRGNEGVIVAIEAR
ncbi:hypothetical protein EDE08_113181 [Bradyrhizobium sp. R2.2-H]|jgi:hypothetical protein|nr:hypothetical protein EDE10_113181 [Bradyrhizobium sp. Y-H1]TCU67714.1 hypothetical protein EDE08_113181 [Bradyrhizobium sp. R2.2-H]